MCYNDKQPLSKANHLDGTIYKRMQLYNVVAQSIVKPTVLILTEQSRPDHG